MKIWFTEIGEPLPIEENVRLHRYGNLTKQLASLGHEVVWWTSNFSHAPKKFLREEDTEEVVNGVRLRILKGLGYKRNISFRRFHHQADFAKRFLEKAQACEKPDLIISPVPTLEVAEVAIRFAKEKGIPCLTDIRDEWPDDFVNIAPKPLQPIARLALGKYFKKMDYICNHSTAILGISQRQLNYGLSFARRRKTGFDQVVPIGYPTERPSASLIAEAKNQWKAQGIREEAIVCCFFGTIGKFFDLKTVIQSAEILSKEMDLQIVFCGLGSRLEEYKSMAANIPSVLFPGWVDAPKIAALMELSDVGLAPYAANAENFSLPNKPFEYFSGGLPVLSSIQGEIKAILENHHCGRTYTANSTTELCEQLRDLKAFPEEWAQMGKNGKELLAREFSTEAIAKNFSNYLEKVVKAHRDNALNQ